MQQVGDSLLQDVIKRELARGVAGRPLTPWIKRLGCCWLFMPHSWQLGRDNRKSRGWAKGDRSMHVTLRRSDLGTHVVGSQRASRTLLADALHR